MLHGTRRTGAAHCALAPPLPAPARPCPLTLHPPPADFKLQLAQTDYKDFLANEPSPLSTNVIKEKCVEKLVNEFNYLRINSAQPLAQFLDYITYHPHTIARARPPPPLCTHREAGQHRG